MSRFQSFFERISGRFPSDTSRYFAKPLLKEAYDQGYADRKAEAKVGRGKVDKAVGGDLVIAGGRSGASSANE